MFLKVADKKDKNTGKTYRYYKLCQSYRIGDKIRHQTILTIGKLEGIESANERKILADRIEQLLVGEQILFSSIVPEHIEKLAHQISSQIKRKGLSKYVSVQTEIVSEKDKHSDYQEVDLSSIEMEDVREIGCEWLCKQALEELKLGDFLKEIGWDDEEIEIALLHIISRACYPASEHKTAQWIQENSAVAELFNRDPKTINRFDLYKASRMLYKEKDRIEPMLSVKTNELFDLDDKIILYDLTNTYFEGAKRCSKIAKYGKSKEKRNDAKLVVLALVVNIHGFVKYSQIFRGNISDCKTLEHIVERLSSCTSNTDRKPIVIIDAGIATSENLSMLKSKQYAYVCVSRSKLKDFEADGEDVIQLYDKRMNSIKVQWVKKQGEDDRFLYVHSFMKQVKESSMNEHFSERYEEELENLSRSIHKKGGIKKYEKVLERIGRIKERYPSVNKHYKINVKSKDGRVYEITWERKSLSHQSDEGVYFIRTNIAETDEKMLWDIYNTIREIEAAFRILKTDLLLRPIHHKTDPNIEAHLYLAILAYTLVNTIRFRLKMNGIHHDWKNIVRIMNTQKVGTVTMQQRNGKQVYIRICSRPTIGVQEIYTAMKYKPIPFYRKKFVFPE